MLFDQFQCQEVCQTPDIFNVGEDALKTDLRSPDFVLTDSFDVNLIPFESKTNTYGLIIESNNVHSEYQNGLIDFDLNGLLGDDLLNNIDFDEFFKTSTFPSLSETSSSSSLVEETQPSIDMIVPASSPTSSISSVSSSLVFKRSKLSPTERKQRKKSQNKTAAEKYRIKKKTERDQLFDRHSALRMTNKQLKTELENWTSRVQQLKQLLKDVVQVDLAL